MKKFICMVALTIGFLTSTALISKENFDIPELSAQQQAKIENIIQEYMGLISATDNEAACEAYKVDAVQKLVQEVAIDREQAQETIEFFTLMIKNPQAFKEIMENLPQDMMENLPEDMEIE